MILPVFISTVWKATFLKNFFPFVSLATKSCKGEASMKLGSQSDAKNPTVGQFCQKSWIRYVFQRFSIYSTALYSSPLANVPIIALLIAPTDTPTTTSYYDSSPSCNSTSAFIAPTS